MLKSTKFKLNVTICKYFSKKPKVLEKCADNINTKRGTRKKWQVLSI